MSLPEGKSASLPAMTAAMESHSVLRARWRASASAWQGQPIRACCLTALGHSTGVSTLPRGSMAIKGVHDESAPCNHAQKSGGRHVYEDVVAGRRVTLDNRGFVVRGQRCGHIPCMC